MSILRSRIWIADWSNVMANAINTARTSYIHIGFIDISWRLIQRARAIWHTKKRNRITLRLKCEGAQFSFNQIGFGVDAWNKVNLASRKRIRTLGLEDRGDERTVSSRSAKFLAKDYAGNRFEILKASFSPANKCDNNFIAHAMRIGIHERHYSLQFLVLRTVLKSIISAYFSKKGITIEYAIRNITKFGFKLDVFRELIHGDYSHTEVYVYFDTCVPQALTKDDVSLIFQHAMPPTQKHLPSFDMYLRVFFEIPFAVFSDLRPPYSANMLEYMRAWETSIFNHKIFKPDPLSHPFALSFIGGLTDNNFFRCYGQDVNCSRIANYLPPYHRTLDMRMFLKQLKGRLYKPNSDELSRVQTQQEEREAALFLSDTTSHFKFVDDWISEADGMINDARGKYPDCYESYQDYEDNGPDI